MGGARKGPAQVILAGAAADGDGVVGRLRLTDLTMMRGRGGESFSKSPGVCAWATLAALAGPHSAGQGQPSARCWRTACVERSPSPFFSSSSFA